MGLSDEERYRNIYSVVSSMVKVARDASVESHYGDTSYPEIRSLVDRLFPALLGGQSNSAHWILGSSFNGQVLDHKNPGEAAVLRAIGDMQPDPWGYRREDFGQASMYDMREERLPTMERLLRDDRGAFMVWELYHLTESYFYAVNRYNDDVTKRFQDTTDIVAKIQGECCIAMSKENFGKAYLLAQIYEVLWTKEEHDLVNQWWAFGYIHHHAKVSIEIDHSRLISLYRQAKTTTLDLSTRMAMTLEVLGHPLHHQWDAGKVLAMVKTWNDHHPDQQVDPGIVESSLALGKKIKEEKTKRDRDQYYQDEYCWIINEVVGDAREKRERQRQEWDKANEAAEKAESLKIDPDVRVQMALKGNPWDGKPITTTAPEGEPQDGEEEQEGKADAEEAPEAGGEASEPDGPQGTST